MSTTHYIPRTLPTTIKLAYFRESLLGSWVVWLQNDTDISTTKFAPDDNYLTVLPAFPVDREINLQIPSIIIDRLSEPFKSSFNNGVATQIITGTYPNELEYTVYNKRIHGMYQFDLLTRDLNSQFTISAYLDKKLFGDSGKNYVRWFKVKDFEQRVGLGTSIPDTDVRVFWKPWRDVNVVRSNAFSTEFEQISYTVNFWCDLWYNSSASIYNTSNIIETLYNH